MDDFRDVVFYDDVFCDYDDLSNDVESDDTIYIIPDTDGQFVWDF